VTAALLGALLLSVWVDFGVAQGRTDKGVVSLEVPGKHLVPGSVVNVEYRTKPGTLQGNADLYFAVLLPGGTLLFLTSEGFVPEFKPFRANVAIADEKAPLFTMPVPVDLPFGPYIFFMGLAYAGTNAQDPANRASSIAQVTVTYAQLSPVQQALLGSLGKPDFLASFWFGLATVKQESWLYRSEPPTRFTFLNGELVSQEAVADTSGGPGPKFDPALFTPQTTEAQLTAILGAPVSVTAVEGSPQFQHVRYGSGLSVILLNGRFSSTVTSTP
jgi:hypothetical protein